MNAYRILSQYPWAITEEALAALVEVITMRAAQPPQTFPAPGRRGGAQATSVGVIPIRGVIQQHEDTSFFAMLFGSGSSTEAISKQLNDFLADESVRSIVLDIDSPGGVAYGVSELSNLIRTSRGTKPIVAVANSVAASAAYWIGAAADQFFASPGAMVGSIGVYTLHLDLSKAAEIEGVNPTYISAGKYKTEGNQFEPLSDEARQHVQDMVDETYAQMVTDIAKGRGVSEATVRSSYGEGRVLMPKQAKAAGMIDGILAFDEVIKRSVKVRTGAPAEVSDGQAAEAPDMEQGQDVQRLRDFRVEQFRAEQALGAIAQGGR